MALSLGVGPAHPRAADLSPNNRVFAMAEAEKGPNDRVSRRI
jgi:hypothetical protein